MSNKPQHQLTGSEELEGILRWLLLDKKILTESRAQTAKEAIVSWHTKHLAKARKEAAKEYLWAVMSMAQEYGADVAIDKTIEKYDELNGKPKKKRGKHERPNTQS